MPTTNRDTSKGTARVIATVPTECVFCNAPIAVGEEFVTDFVDCCARCDATLPDLDGDLAYRDQSAQDVWP